MVHFLGVWEHLGIVEKKVDGLGVLGEDALAYLMEFLVCVVIGVPGGPAMDPLVDDLGAQDGPGELGCVDADEENLMVFCPSDELVGEQVGVAELDCNLVGPCLFEELLQD